MPYRPWLPSILTVNSTAFETNPMTLTPITDAARGNILDANADWPQEFDPCPDGAYVPAHVALGLEQHNTDLIAHVKELETQVKTLTEQKADLDAALSAVLKAAVKPPARKVSIGNIIRDN